MTLEDILTLLTLGGVVFTEIIGLIKYISITAMEQHLQAISKTNQTYFILTFAVAILLMFISYMGYLNINTYNSAQELEDLSLIFVGVILFLILIYFVLGITSVWINKIRWLTIIPLIIVYIFFNILILIFHRIDFISLNNLLTVMMLSALAISLWAFFQIFYLSHSPISNTKMRLLTPEEVVKHFPEGMYLLHSLNPDIQQVSPTRTSLKNASYPQYIYNGQSNEIHILEKVVDSTNVRIGVKK